MNERPFDVGVIVEDYPGYRWPLSAWRTYYYHNVTGTGAITHEQFAKECPKALEALQKSDEQERAMMEALHNPSPALLEVLRQFVQAQTEAVTTGQVPQAVANQPAQVAPQAPQAQQQPVAQPQPLVPHTHGFNPGDMQTAEENGHMHNIVNGECEEFGGHTHAMQDLQGGNGAPAAKAVPPMASQTPNPVANAPQKQGA